MAGITEANYKSNDEGKEVSTQQVPTIGGTDGAPSTAPVVVSAHLGDAMRAEGVNYNSNESVGMDVTTGAYPTGTAMNDSTPSDDIN